MSASAAAVAAAAPPRGGPLAGTRVVELAGVGPGPHAAMVLADLGAEVVRVERPGTSADPAAERDPTLRGRRRIVADLKTAAGRDAVLGLAGRADVLVEGFRPGVTERLGVGPDDCLARNPRLVYARMTGWGQHGPWAARAGHDINYISVTGVLHAIGPGGGAPPVPPLNLVGDYGGGSMSLLVGVLAALLEARGSGRGQVVDAAMVDGVSTLAQVVWTLLGQGRWVDASASNLLDGHAPFYGTYRCADDRFVAVGAIEPAFWGELLGGLGLDPAGLPSREDPGAWPALRARLADVFRTRTRDEWAAVFEGTDACVTPVLSFAEAAGHPHLAARGTIVVPDGGRPQAAPSPRFSRTPAAVPGAPAPVEEAGEVLADWGGTTVPR